MRDCEDGSGAWAIPGDSEGMPGKRRRGSGRHIGTPVFTSEGASQNAVFGYGNLILLDGTRVIRAPNALIQKLLRTHSRDAILETNAPGCLPDSTLSSTMMVSRAIAIRAE